MPTLLVQIVISPQAFLKYYQGVAQNIVVHAVTGERVQLPASALRKFVTPHGINGRFEVSFSETGKLLNIAQL
ncbi:MAG: DUF2835 domain-containing protein [Candidatus Berkiella sp.]